MDTPRTSKSAPSAVQPAPVSVARRADLTRREQQTLVLLLAGLSDKEIGARLGISAHTVNDYTKSLFLRFGVHSRASLISRLLCPPGASSLPRRRF